MRRTLVLIGVFALVLAAAVPAGAQSEIERTDRQLPESIEQNRLSEPALISGTTQVPRLDPALAGATGDQHVIVRLSGESLAESGLINENSATRHVQGLRSAQDAFIGRVMSVDPGATVLGSVQRVLNAVFISVDGGALAEIAADPAVERIARVGDYQLDLTETVPYIGATATQDLGFDGSGITVAVLDSGIDYLHANLGGSGDPADFAANDPTVIEPGTFPTDKVVAGYDFVGENWVGGADTPPLAPDPDPLDAGSGAGHGTHVADIIGGTGGVAPGVELVAVKVCSAIATSCSGVALIQGMEFAVDPDGNGNVKDRVDIINMSLGSLYGQPFDDDLSAAVDGATALGVLTVASAGNSGDVPFITGSPAASRTALSVAQTQVPSAALQLIDVDGVASSIPAVFQPWSVPVGSVITGPTQYGDGAGGNLNGCAAFAAGSLDGLVVLVDRGACNFTLKIKNISDAGGAVGIIGLVAPGAPFSGGDGGDRPIDIPGFMIDQASANAIKAVAGNTATVDPANTLPLIGQMVGSSSRGPQFQDLTIKPEIGAPGASVSAETGTGTGETPFGGTSGAAPMVSGSAALVLEAFGGSQTTGRGGAKGNPVALGLDPLRLKALLMNNADPDIDIDPFSGLAEITRIGAGEVRVDAAATAPVAVYDEDGYSGSLSFGFHDASTTFSITRTVTIANLDNTARTYDITPTFRGPDTGAVTVSAPSSVTVQRGVGRTASFDVTLTIDPSLLPNNVMNSGASAGVPATLNAMEFDGYLVMESGDDTVTVPWHVFPRKSADVDAERATFEPGLFPDSIGLTNNGAGPAQLDAYSIVAVDPDDPDGARGAQSPSPDLEAVGVTTIPVGAGFCSGVESFLWIFAFDHHDRQTNGLVPGISWIDLDTNQDGTPDYAVYSYSLAGLGDISDPRVVTFAAPWVDFDAGLLGPQSAFFFAEQNTITGNTVLIICGEQIGLTGTDMLTTNVDAQAYAFDIYFGGPGDASDPFTITPLGERYFGLPSGDLAPGASGGLDVYDFGTFPGNTEELGVMLITNGDRGAASRGAATEATESLKFLAED